MIRLAIVLGTVALVIISPARFCFPDCDWNYANHYAPIIIENDVCFHEKLENRLVEPLQSLPEADWQQVGVPYETAWDTGAEGTLAVVHDGVEKSLAGAVEAGRIRDTASAWNAEEQESVEVTGETGAALDPRTGYWIYTFVDDVTLHFSQEPGLGRALPSSAATRSADHFPTLDEDDYRDLEPSSQQPNVRVINAPNPVREAHTTTFMVKGICTCRVFGLVVSVYGLDGRLVWEGRTSGPELKWHTEDETGQRVANGMYIYVAQVNVDGQWVPVEPGKLAASS